MSEERVRTAPLRVALADDHAMVREALAGILDESARVEVVGQAADGHEALRVVEEARPDVLVLDFTMPGLDGPRVIEAVRERGLPLKVLVLTVHESLHYAARVLEAGADGFIVKSAAVDDLLAAIEATHEGEVYVSPSLSHKVLEHLARPRERRGLESLSPREFDVLCAFGSGLGLRECAHYLGIGVSTASTYRTRLMEKLGLQSTTEIIRFALEHDLVA